MQRSFSLQTDLPDLRAFARLDRALFLNPIPSAVGVEIEVISYDDSVRRISQPRRIALEDFPSIYLSLAMQAKARDPLRLYTVLYCNQPPIFQIKPIRPVQGDRRIQPPN